MVESGVSVVHTVFVMVPASAAPIFKMAATALENYAPEEHRLFNVKVVSEEVSMKLYKVSTSSLPNILQLTLTASIRFQQGTQKQFHNTRSIMF